MLAQLPTPLERLDRTSARLGREIWVKRDDLTGFGLSGNKVRKLDHLLREAQARGATTVLTTGGIQSNHCRATAVAARQVGLKPVLLLRGEPPARLEGNLLIDALLGARVHWVDRAGYADRDAHLERLAAACRAAGEEPYIIPEGGSNAMGAEGFVEAGHELAQQAAARGLCFDSVVFAVGSGGTLAGLAMAGLESRVLGVAVCDGRAYFRDRVEQIAKDSAKRFGRKLPPAGHAWDVIEGFQGAGYGLSQAHELRHQVRLAREQGLLLDPVYTGKAWTALETLAPKGELGRTVLFWHTGGFFGATGRGDEYAAAVDDLGPLGFRV